MNIVYQLPVDISKQGRRFVAYSPALDIATSGKTENEVKRRFGELVEVLFEELREAGTLENVLRELGWKKAQKKWQTPEISQQSVGVRVVLPA